MTRPTTHLRTTPFRRPACGTLLLTTLLALAGCHGSGSASSGNTAAEQAKPNYIVIHAAHAPTSVLVPNGGHLKIVDVGTDRAHAIDKVIFDTKLPPNALVTLNPDGVSINARPTRATGPYPRSHTYEFRLFQ